MLEELYSKQPMLKEVFGELYNMKKLLGEAEKDAFEVFFFCV